MFLNRKSGIENHHVHRVQYVQLRSHLHILCYTGEQQLIEVGETPMDTLSNIN
jgi:hypothetical protein